MLGQDSLCRLYGPLYAYIALVNTTEFFLDTVNMSVVRREKKTRTNAFQCFHILETL